MTVHRIPSHRQRRARLQVEQLETRLVPATWVSPTTVTYTDVDGDRVTVVSSKPLFQAEHLDSLFTFNPPFATGPQQLQVLRLTLFAGAASG